MLEHLGAAYKALNVPDSAEFREGIEGLFELADDPAALCQGRIRWWLRHHERNVPRPASCRTRSSEKGVTAGQRPPGAERRDPP